MLKIIKPLKSKSIESDSAQALTAILADVPFIKTIATATHTESRNAWAPDFEIKLRTAEGGWTLACEVKSVGEPRNIRVAVSQLREYVDCLSKKGVAVYPIVMAPFLSDASQDICKEARVGYADLSGNCLISFSNIYISRQGTARPFAQRRVQRSLFAPKSARVLKLLLRKPNERWKVVDLAKGAEVSVGQVSNLRSRLLEMEFANADASGMWLMKPAGLLELWRESYRSEALSATSCYTLLHGQTFEDSLIRAQRDAQDGRHAVLASYSAANWIAPYLRNLTPTVIYADRVGEEYLFKYLDLELMEKGSNVMILQPTDDGPFLDRIKKGPGVWVTSPIQTYLDLTQASERGMEAAAHLFDQAIRPSWNE